jgi:hypothetical protein
MRAMTTTTTFENGRCRPLVPSTADPLLLRATPLSPNEQRSQLSEKHGFEQRIVIINNGPLIQQW